MRGVVGGDGVNGAIGERDQNGFASAAERSGGFILQLVLYRHIFVEQSEWCGVTSQVTWAFMIPALATAHSLAHPP